ncbi:MAG: hypothetical protein KDD55_13300, partial [Bdellovibrionales bacterium]|nr:hypothetical protein [Bdellovibrionales bacterium]
MSHDHHQAEHHEPSDHRTPLRQGEASPVLPLPTNPLDGLTTPPANHDVAHQNGTTQLLDTTNIPERALLHLQQHPFQAPENAHECSVWFEGTFDPIGPHHLEIIEETLRLGFQRVNLGIVFQNPYKPQSSSFEHRHEMARRALEKAGIRVIDSPEECFDTPGVFIPTTQMSFDHHRMKAIFGERHYILLGPDNFEKAIAQNTLWVHTPEIRDNPHADRFFGFRRMYDKIPDFKRTVLVYPGLHNIHATDIRTGRAKGIDVVSEYADAQALYVNRTDHTAVPKAGPLLKWGQGISVSDDLLRHELSQDLTALLSGHGFSGEPVAFALHRALSKLDYSALIELSARVQGHFEALDREFEGRPTQSVPIKLQAASPS